jgi:hypothetical protein
MVICAMSLAVSGCVTRTPANDGAGFERLTPSAATRQFIIANDRPFAEQVVAHNETCDQQPACRK